MTMYSVTLSNGYSGWLAAHDKLDLVWQLVSGMLQEAREHNRGEFELEDVYMALRENQMQLWCVSKGEDILAAAVTELAYYARFASLRVVLLGGADHTKWQELWPSLEHFARLYGCRYIEALTRPGVERMFRKATGLREVYRMLSVPVHSGSVQ